MVINGYTLYTVVVAEAKFFNSNVKKVHVAKASFQVWFDTDAETALPPP